MTSNMPILKTFSFNTIYITQPTFNACFYSIRSFFVFYAIWRLGTSEAEAIGIFSMFMASCYGTALFGGYLADRSLSVKGGVVLGGILSALGLLCLFFPSQSMCFLGLALFSVGSGLFKPNLMAAVGLTFEDPKDVRKGQAYSMVYALGNVGMITLVPLCGFVGTWYGWPHALAIVLVLMVVATLLVYKTMRFHPSYQAPSPSVVKSVGIIGALVLVIYGLLNYTAIFKMVTFLSVFGSIIYLAVILCRCNPEERQAVIATIGYILLFAFFVSFFEQSASSFNFFLRDAVNCEAMGLLVPPSVIQALGPLFVLLCAFTLLPLFSRYVEKEKPMEGSFKVGCGFFLAAASFFILAFGSIQEVGSLVPLPWIILALFLQTLGELWVGPVILSKISQAAPSRFQSTLISFWTMAIAYGHCIAGIIAQFSITSKVGPKGDIGHFVNFFGSLGVMAMVIGVLIFVGRGVVPSILVKLAGTSGTDAD